MTPERGRDAAVRRQAVDPSGSFIVQAPAGSGKTSLLTLRYLRLLATVECPEQIVAITFTRKAASEMRHRIVRALAAAARPLPAGAAPHEQELHAAAAAALARSGERAWDLERNPARLHVQTIDGLNHWLARRLPLAARIGMSAALVDDPAPLYREAARRLVASLDDGGARTAPLERLARALDHEPQQLARLVAGMLGAREVWLPKLFGPAGDGRLRAEIDGLLRSALEAELARAARSVADFLPAALFEVIREAAAAGGTDSPLAPLAQLRGLPPATAAGVPAWQALASLLLTADKQGALRRKVDKHQGFPAASAGTRWKELKQRMHQQLDALAGADGLAASLVRVRQLPPGALSASQWERIEALVAVLPHAVAELLASFAQRGSIDHAAVAAAARDALRDESAPTELALALDYRIHHLLVDEYQDTSPAQEQLLKLLLAGWQQGDGRTLFCVGDPMQSIYAFREADVTLFLQAAGEGVGGVPLVPLRLSRNFRSSAAIVDWVNGAFAALLPAEDDFERGAVRYSPAEAVHAEVPGDGVRVHALLDADEREMGEEAARTVAAVLAAAAAGARPTIALLVRGRTSLPPLIAALRAAGIPYRGVELESLTHRAAIRDLVALAKAMLHAGDRSAWLAVLRAPWCGLTLADLLAVAGDDADALLPARIADPALVARLSADGASRVQRLREALAGAVPERDRRSLGGWVKAAWLALRGPATVGDASDVVNAELLFAALDQLEVETGGRPEASAVDAAADGIMASPVGGEDAPVQVMTIHKAKGLEFDVVIVPDLQRTVRGGERPLLYWTQVATGPGQRGIILASRGERDDAGADADALEGWMRRLAAEREALELGRVAYVAATRARRELHLIGSAATRWTEDGPELCRPRSGSLLDFFWPVLQQEFERALAVRGDAGAEHGREGDRRRRLRAPPLLRLPVAWVPPEPPALRRATALRIAGEPEGSIRPEFDWAGTIAQAVGQVVHLELHRLARLGLPREALRPRPEAWRRALVSAGVDEAHLPLALARTGQAIAGFAQSALAGRLLDPGAAEAASELALTAVIDGVVQSLRIDRSFVDPDGVRWIVDWKTSTHEGGDREVFLDNELARYAPQLRRYAEAMRALDGRPQRVGLYFPLLDAWREL
ncbi:MAG: UvrD-helicase domain-containing protein [Steroidobacteraceae bacterium]|nr:UvrD-helicase domain-containing protein [Steroidobacteraceae bacterium]